MSFWRMGRVDWMEEGDGDGLRIFGSFQVEIFRSRHIFFRVGQGTLNKSQRSKLVISALALLVKGPSNDDTSSCTTQDDLHCKSFSVL